MLAMVTYSVPHSARHPNGALRSRASRGLHPVVFFSPLALPGALHPVRHCNPCLSATALCVHLIRNLPSASLATRGGVDCRTR